MSKYAEVAAALQSEIEQGTYEPGDKLPITPDLCKLYGVSNTTIKRPSTNSSSSDSSLVDAGRAST